MWSVEKRHVGYGVKRMDAKTEEVSGVERSRIQECTSIWAVLVFSVVNILGDALLLT